MWMEVSKVQSVAENQQSFMPRPDAASGYIFIL